MDDGVDTDAADATMAADDDADRSVRLTDVDGRAKPDRHVTYI